MLPVVLFGIGLTVSTLAVCMTGDASLRRSAAAMVANWMGVLVVVSMSGDLAPWFMFLALDVAAALVVLRAPASRPQAIIGSVYLFQITFHIAYALVGSAAALPLYLDLLAMGGWLQLCTLFWGAIHGGGMRYSDTVAAGGHLPAAGAQDRFSLGPPR
jgi:hypothetical protein